MKLFLDSSVLLAAAGSATGASRALFDLAAANQWTLTTSRYCLAETLKNIGKLSPAAIAQWEDVLAGRLVVVQDAVALRKPLAFSKGKDKPVLITALAEDCDALLTLDRKDFATVLNTRVYSLHVCTPAMFLEHQRAQGRLEGL